MATQSAAFPAEGSKRSRPRRGWVLTLIVAGGIIGVVGTVALWARRQALDTDAWTATSLQLIQDPEIQQAVSNYLANSLFASVDVRAELQRSLPPDTRGLALPASFVLREGAERAANEALQLPLVQRLWAEANRAAHRTMMAAISGGTDVLTTTGGVVTLNLVPLVQQVGARLGLELGERIPPGVGTIEIVSSDRLARVQGVARALHFWGALLPILALLLLALAVYLARGWRREALEDVGFALAAIGVLVLIFRAVAGGYVVESLAAPSVEPAARSVWRIGTSLLHGSAVSLIAYGVVIVLGTWLAGPRPSATRARHTIGPVLRDRRIAYGVLGVLILLLLWWQPVPATQWLLPMLILLALAVAGIEALRRISLQDLRKDSLRGPVEAAQPEARRKAG